MRTSNGLFDEKYGEFAIFQTNCWGFARFKGQSGGLLKQGGVEWRVSGIGCQAHRLLAEGEGKSATFSLAQGSLQRSTLTMARHNDDHRLKFSSKYVHDNKGT
jgi:hypothetical protein